MQNVVRSFVDDARTILAYGPTDDALAQLMARMRLLIRHPTVLEGTRLAYTSSTS